MVRTGGRGRLRAALFVGIGLGMTGFALIAYGANVFRQLELDTVDTRFAVRGTQEPPPELVVVQIDDVTFDELDQRWPFPRTIHARVVDRLREDGARGIFFDVQFTEPSEREEEDIALIEAVERARGKVALATTETNEDGGSNIFGGEETLRDIGARSGNALLPEDSGGIIRRVAYAVDGLEAFSLVGAEIVTGREIDPSELGGGEDGAWIDYHGPPGTIRAISYSQVSERKTDAGFFRDRIVIVGPSAPSLQDVHPTSTSGDDLMSGAEIQANALSTA
ncbi:MAG: CHASE2 domain-containing protein, partial [Gaiellaceae bacterium]